MTINVQLFARARDLAGADRVALELSATGRVRELRDELARRCPPLAAVASTLLVAVDNQYAADELLLDPQAEVACFPPVSGG